tara:strand:- start:910 stop:1293 length:384 start_codon:yes stop_codon:yes gene_type:complete
MAKLILHVDDDPIILDIVKATFQHDEEIKVASVRNAFDAFASIQSLEPDLIIVDIAIPDMGGFELILELRKLSEAATTPIIILSGRARSLGAHNPFQQMAVVVLEKPVEPDRLRYEAKSLLARGGVT